jgi:hypothetical protein
MNEDSTYKMWRGAILPSTVVALMCVVGSAIARQKPGFLGALIASATVIIFLGIHLGISAISKNLDPIAVMGMAMFSYFAKILVMGGLLLFVSQVTAPTTVNRATFAITALAITAAWLGGEIRAFFRLKIGLPLPPTREGE